VTFRIGNRNDKRSTATLGDDLKEGFVKTALLCLFLNQLLHVITAVPSITCKELNDLSPLKLNGNYMYHLL
jgi:hypothetical protein